MTGAATSGSPFAGAEIGDALRALHAESVRYWSSLDTPTFLAPIGAAWSPAENVRHLTKSIRAVTGGLKVPRLALLVRFGRPKRESRTYAEVRDLYRARLADGATAGRFGPGPTEPSADIEAERARIMSYHATAVEAMVGAIHRWPERALDRRQLPHPLLGPLTVREMLLFTLYHNGHHVDTVRRRMGSAS